jgi:hypothetical protein
MPKNQFDVKQSQDVLPALREMLARRPHCADFDAKALSLVLWFRNYLPYPPDEAEVEAALEALRLEGEVVA